GSPRIGKAAGPLAGGFPELLAIIAGRRDALRETSGAAPPLTPDVIVVFDGSRKLRSLPGAVQILREGPAVGVLAICLDTDERLLPAECQAVAVVEPDGLRVQQMSAATFTGVRPDH